MTDPEKFDPAAFLSECARVHEAATPGTWRFHPASGSQPDGIWCNGSSITDDAPYYPSAPSAADMVAIAHYHNTYAALLDVARNVDDELDRARRELARHIPGSTAWFSVETRLDVLECILAPLSRLAAAGGGR